MQTVGNLTKFENKLLFLVLYDFRSPKVKETNPTDIYTRTHTHTQINNV